MSKESRKIDFVITWVDGQDQNWVNKRNYYVSDGDNSIVRYRDFGLLKYWFRCVEKYASWVNKIYLITDHQIPSWLNRDNKKLVLVYHEDYIPEEYLPTFNSNVIELFMHLIPELSDSFVYFNDDMFIIDYMKPEDFFLNGKPRDCAILNVLKCDIDGITNIVANDLMIINKYFNFNESLKNNFRKWINLKYGKDLIRTLILSIWNTFPSFLEVHLPNSYLKSTFEDVWAVEEELLRKTCENKFRSPTDCNQWLMRYWQLASGEFVPRSPKIGKMFSVLEEKEIIDCINYQRKKLICINDSEQVVDFENCRNNINQAFVNLLPDKSSFEI